MKILFICPQPKDLLLTTYEKKKTSLFHKIMLKLTSINKNMSLPILAAVTPREHTVMLQEGTFDEINFNIDCDIVGITYTTLDALCAYKIADEFKRRKITVILGGYHASALPDEAKQHADAVVIGEAEEIWPQILKDFERGKLKPFYKQDRPTDPRKIPIPLFEMYPKNASLGIQASRGCPMGCEFCSITNARFRNIFRPRPIEDVIEEISLNPQKNISFYDPSLTIDPSYTKALFKGIKDSGINKKFACYGNINILAKDDELLKLASEAGVIQWEIGFESIIQKSLNDIGKKSNRVKEYAKGIRKIHNYNMMILGDFVFGFDNDPPDIGDKTLEFVNDSDIDIPDVQILTPFPGTPLFNRLENEGRIITKDWSKYDFEHVVFKPKRMTVEELYENAKIFFKKSYKKTKILKRVIRGINLGYDTFVVVLFENLTMSTKRYI